MNTISGSKMNKVSTSENNNINKAGTMLGHYPSRSRDVTPLKEQMMNRTTISFYHRNNSTQQKLNLESLEKTALS